MQHSSALNTHTDSSSRSREAVEVDTGAVDLPGRTTGADGEAEEEDGAEELQAHVNIPLLLLPVMSPHTSVASSSRRTAAAPPPLCPVSYYYDSASEIRHTILELY